MGKKKKSPEKGGKVRCVTRIELSSGGGRKKASAGPNGPFKGTEKEKIRPTRNMPFGTLERKGTTD